jgi:hydroxypyruvate isomerase
MPKFAANLSWMFTEYPFLERFEAAARAGFRAVEFPSPYQHSPEAIADRLRTHGLRNVLFNSPPGNVADGKRGLASIPGREAEFRDSLALALRYASVLGTPQLHVMAGVMTDDRNRIKHRETYVANLRYAATETANAGITALIEPINTRDMPGYFLNTQADAHAIREEIGSPNLKVQMDLYHAQIVEGDLETKLRRYLPYVGHIQIAGVPDRHEPDIGEVNYPYLFRLLDELGYAGWIGCEYRPANGTAAGLGWMVPYLNAPQ